MRRGFMWAALPLVVLLSSCGDVVKKDLTDAGPGTDDASDGPADSSFDGSPPAAPAITAITPTWGSSAGGTNVKITGSGFSAPNLVVNFGTGAATNVNVVSDTEVRVVTPAGPNALVDVKMTTAGGVTTFVGSKFKMLAPLYAADGRGKLGNLYAVNPATGQSSSVGAIGAPVTGLALSPAGVLYAATTAVSPNPPQLVILDPYTGGRTVVGNLTTSAGVTTGVMDLAFEGNRLLGWHTGQMVEVNVLSGQVSLYTVTMTTGGGRGIASRSTGTLAFSPLPANAALYSVNTSNGAATAGPTMNGPAQTINSLTFVGGTMFGSVASPSGAGQTVALYSIDPTTGATSLKGALPMNIDAIEGIPTQPAIPLAAPDEPPTAAAPQAPAAVAAEPAPAPAATIVVGGRTQTVADVLALGAVTKLADREQPVVSLGALKRLAGTAGHVQLVDAGGQALSLSLTDASYALIANQRGELKLIAPRAGTHKVFGPVAELRFTR